MIVEEHQPDGVRSDIEGLRNLTHLLCLVNDLEIQRLYSWISLA